MRIVGDFDTMKIIGPVIRPFSERELSACPACGIRANGWWRAFLRKLRGKKPEYVVRMRFCPGDKPPTEKLEGFASLMGFRSEVEHKCSGIPEPHLHCTCEHCHAEWFTKTRT